MRYLVICTIFLTINMSYAQDYETLPLESLEDEELLDYFNQVESDSLKAEVIARTYLSRGRQRKDTIMMARGYDRLARIFSPTTNLKYADSIIYLTKDHHQVTYPALAYAIKGYNYGHINNIQAKTESYLQGYEIAVIQKNIGQQVWFLHLLIYGQCNWGNKRDALRLQFIRDSLINSPAYIEGLKTTTRSDANVSLEQLLITDKINSHLSFAKCYLSLDDYNLVNYHIKKQDSLLKHYSWIYKPYHEINLGLQKIESEYKNNHFENSLKEKDNLINSHGENLVHIDYFEIYKYAGLSKLKLGQIQEGIAYLKKVDSLTKLNDYSFTMGDRIVFEELLKSARKFSNKEKQIELLNQLIIMDSMYIRNYRYFSPNMIKRFDIPHLIDEKESVISSLKTKGKAKSKVILGVVSLLILSLVGLCYYFIRQKTYRRRYSLLMQKELKDELDGKTNKICERKSALSPQLVSEILEKLQLFEDNNQFLDTQLTLHSLAKKIGTNPTYLSRIVNLKMEKNFAQYLHTLRINYALDEIKNNATFRKYSIKAIAHECGYKTAESFSRRFYKEIGFYPSYYVKKIEESIQ